jgi:hypothetical protein
MDLDLVNPDPKHCCCAQDVVGVHFMKFCAGCPYVSHNRCLYMLYNMLKHSPPLEMKEILYATQLIGMLDESWQWTACARTAGTVQ